MTDKANMPAPVAETPQQKPAWASHLWKGSVAAREARAAAQTGGPAPVAPATKPLPPKAANADRRLLTIKSTGEALDCGRSTVYRLINDGKLRTVKLSTRAVRVVSADVEALLLQAA